MRYSILLFFFFLLPLCQSIAQDKPMNNTQLEEIIKREASKVEGEIGFWQIIFEERLLFLITDEANNRMRIFTPIVEEEAVDESEMKKMLIANFHTALDAKYSIYNGLVISVFTHPLGELTENQFVDAMKQVTTLADTFGTTYTSTELIFGGNQGEEEKKVNESPTKSTKKI